MTLVCAFLGRVARRESLSCRTVTAVLFKCTQSRLHRYVEIVALAPA